MKNLPPVILEEVVSYIEFKELLILRLLSKSTNEIMVPKIWYYFEFVNKDSKEMEYYLKKYSKYIKYLVLLFIQFSSIENYVNYFIALEKLEITCTSKKLIDEALLVFSKIKPDLKAISISSISNTALEFNILIKFTYLNQFCLDNVYLPGLQMPNLIESINNNHLRKLELTVSSIQTQDICLIAKRFSQLSIFNLSSTIIPSEDNSKFIFPKFLNLLQLHLKFTAISESSSNFIIFDSTDFENLIDLKFESAYQYENTPFEIMGILHNVKNIRLNILNQDFFDELIIALPNIEEIELRCISNEDNLINKFISSFPKLKSICLSQISSSQKLIACDNMAKLESIKLYFAEEISMHFLEYLITKGQNLKKLDISYCELSQDFLDALDKIPDGINLDNLVSLTLSSLPPPFIDWFIKSCPNLNCQSKTRLSDFKSNHTSAFGILA